ncbi:hypothetical protein ACJX0J_033888, partial [Zea mays]
KGIAIWKILFTLWLHDWFLGGFSLNHFRSVYERMSAYFIFAIFFCARTCEKHFLLYDVFLLTWSDVTWPFLQQVGACDWINQIVSKGFVGVKQLGDPLSILFNNANWQGSIHISLLLERKLFLLIMFFTTLDRDSFGEICEIDVFLFNMYNGTQLGNMAFKDPNIIIPSWK